LKWFVEPFFFSLVYFEKKKQTHELKILKQKKGM